MGKKRLKKINIGGKNASVRGEEEKINTIISTVSVKKEQKITKNREFHPIISPATHFHPLLEGIEPTTIASPSQPLSNPISQQPFPQSRRCDNILININKHKTRYQIMNKKLLT